VSLFYHGANIHAVVEAASQPDVAGRIAFLEREGRHPERHAAFGAFFWLSSTENPTLVHGPEGQEMEVML